MKDGLFENVLRRVDEAGTYDELMDLVQPFINVLVEETKNQVPDDEFRLVNEDALEELKNTSWDEALHVAWDALGSEHQLTRLFLKASSRWDDVTAEGHDTFSERDKAPSGNDCF